MPAAGAIGFVLVKFLAYTAWCLLGLRLLADPGPASRMRRAALLGLVRVALGFGLGWCMVFAMTLVAPERSRLGVSLPLLVGGFVLLRWLEWSFVGALATGGAASPRAILLGSGIREHAWRAGGLGLSFATDVAGVLGAGVLGIIPC